jgi:hypothetical protein
MERGTDVEMERAVALLSNGRHVPRRTLACRLRGASPRIVADDERQAQALF